MIGNVSDWLSYAGGALIKVADSAGSTVCSIHVFQKMIIKVDYRFMEMIIKGPISHF